ncbi:MAG TPA: AI-2E family transporter, partial [Rhodocyclaceae bacterium]|nr:AI-2E family transporter [Rhodocyclaceae bacterium]
LTRHQIAAWTITALLLFLTLTLHLLPALLAGLLVYELVRLMAGRLSGGRARLVAVVIIAALVILFISLASVGLVAYFRSDGGSLQALLQKMAEILDNSRHMLPTFVVTYLPADAEAIRLAAVQWLQTHAGEVQVVGAEAGRGAAHGLIGMIIGAMLALHEVSDREPRKPFAAALEERAMRLADAFRRIVFAQVRIAGINAFFTALYLVVALPLLGVHLPLTKSMIAFTFIAGLLPVVGNLVSNTVIVVVSLAHSPSVALASLVFLIVIHKLEYFLNAKIVGNRINARAWELLLAMLLMEAAFGLPGVVAAPVYYAYLKDELRARGLV